MILTQRPILRGSRVLLALALLAGCSSGGSGSGAGTSYQGPGSHYQIDLDLDGSFRVSASDDPTGLPFLTVDGTYQRLATGFLEMTVTDATGVDAPSPGDQAIGLEVPGFALLLRPLDGEGELSPLLISGECPDTAFTANWFTTTCRENGFDCDATNTERGWFGSFHYDAVTGIASVPAEYAIADASSEETSPIGGATCTDGVMEVDGARVYLTRSGGAIVYTNPGDEDEAKHIVAMPKETLDAELLAGDYAGLVFDPSSDEVIPLNATFAANGMTASLYEVDIANLDTAVSGAAIASLSFDAVNEVGGAAEAGWLSGTLDNGEELARPVYCTADVGIADTDRNLVLCVGQSPGEAADHYNVVLISRS